VGHGAYVTRPSITTPALLVRRLTTTHTGTRTSSYLTITPTTAERVQTVWRRFLSQVYVAYMRQGWDAAIVIQVQKLR